MGHRRERIPERVVHAKGVGAHGYFEVTHDVTQYTRARFLSEVGKRTEVFKLAKKTAGRDPITYELIVHILGEEIEHEDEFENLMS